MVVGSRQAAETEEAFIWQPGLGSRRLELPPGLAGSSSAHSVSDDGRIVVGRCTDAFGRSIPLRWVDSLPELLPLPPGGGFGGFAAKVSRDGKIVVGVAGSANSENRTGWRVCLWREGSQQEFIESSPSEAGYADPSRLLLSSDGSSIAMAVGAQRQIHRWSADTGFVPLKLEPASHDFSYPGNWQVAMTGDGSVLGTARFQKRIFRWDGWGAGVPLPITLTTNPAAKLVTNDRGSLLAGMTVNRLFGGQWSSLVVPPFGPLPFEDVLRGQGCDLGAWSSLTNISAISADGQWVMGWGSAAPSDDSPAHVEAFRAKLIRHAQGAPRLDVEVLNPDADDSIHRLRWPATDLLVAVESTPLIHPTVPWTAESGAPRIEGNEIVLDLERVTEARYFRLRRLD